MTPSLPVEPRSHRSTLGRLFPVILCLIAAASAGCRGNHHRAQGSTITVLYPIDERGLASGLPSQFLVFLPLVTRNVKGELEGRLAESWDHSSDYRTWTVHLRKDVRWQDGVPVTAHDIKFTLDLLSHPAVLVASPGAYSIRVLDDFTYAITYARRAIGSPGDDYYTVYYPKHLLEGLDPKKFHDWDFWKHPVGDGPYRYVRTVPKTMIEVEANPDYYQGKPRIERVVLKFGEPSLTELLSGNADTIPCCYLNAMDLLKLKGDSRFRSYFFIQPEKLNAIIWNHHHPAFRDPRVRRALTLAINRRELHQVLNLPDDLPIFDAFVTERQFLRREFPKVLPYNPKEAKRLLDEAGWGTAGKDGVRERDGKAFRFTALVTPLQQLEKAAIYIQAQLRQVGVQMDVTLLDDQAKSQRIKAGEFDAALGVAILASPRARLELFGQPSAIGYANPKVIALVQKAQTSMNPDEIDRVHRELVPFFQADLPVTFLYPAVWPTVAHRRVKGLSSPYRADPVWYMEDLWLDDRSGQ